MTALRRLSAVALAITTLGGCANDEKVELADIRVLRIGVVPDREEARLRERHRPLIDYLSKETGIDCQLVIPESYKDLLALFLDKKIDLAYFGGYTFVKANRAAGATPLVFRAIDRKFTSVYIAHPETQAESIEDLRGMRFAFGSKLSTSGHLMPRYFMKERGIIPEQFFADVLYSGAHDQTTLLVRNGVVDAGVANLQIVEAMIADDLLTADEVRIIEVTPPYANYVWSLRADLPDDLANAIRSAFLRLSPDDPSHALVLESQYAKVYLPASKHDFEDLERADDLLTIGEQTP